MIKNTWRIMQLSTASITAYKFAMPIIHYLQELEHTKHYHYESCLACNTGQFSDASSFADELRALGYSLHHIPIPRTISPVADLIALWMIYRLLREFKPHILHTHNSKAGILGRIAGKLAAIPVIIHTAYDYGPIIDAHGTQRGKMLATLERLVSRLSDRILFITSDGIEHCLEFKIAPPDKLVNVGVGISFEEFNPDRINDTERDMLKNRWNLPPNKLIVGTLARLIPHKRIDVLLQAARIVKERRPDIHFIIAGGGPEEDNLKALVDMLGLSNDVTFTGYLAQTDVPVYLSLLDVFWLSTQREGFGLVYIEANAMGIPVIGSNISPVDYVIGEHIGGLLADPNSPEDFARQCFRLLENSALRSQLGKDGKQRSIRLFDETLSFERIAAVYEAVLQEKGLSIRI